MTKPKRHKGLEVHKEPQRPKAHWDHVLEEMVWLSKDFESERKWKLAQAKKVASRASKGILDHATWGEKKLKEEEHRLRKLALNISKDVKKFWLKIEKLVLYKHQMELDEKKKKALDKQLEFLLGQTERYSTMLAENLVDSHVPLPQKTVQDQDQMSIPFEANGDDANELLGLDADIDEDFDFQSEDESDDDEQTVEVDEALITEEERQEEIAALRGEAELPLEELLKRYAGRDGKQIEEGEDGNTNLMEEHDIDKGKGKALPQSNKVDGSNSLVRRSSEKKGGSPLADDNSVESEACLSGNAYNNSKDPANQDAPYDFSDEQEDCDYAFPDDEKDDEATLSEEEELAKADSTNSFDEIALLQRESEIPVEELLAKYRNDLDNEVSKDVFENAPALSEDPSESPEKHKVSDEDKGAEQSGGNSVLQAVAEQEEANHLGESDDSSEGENRIADAAAAARSAQPTGNTFSTTKVRTKFPFLLKHPLREYQHIGLDWLVTMYKKRLNGILADEMGLGKTIMTIALLAHLACEKGLWGPHLIVVPTSVMLNWETEFLRWCPAFKILTYFGSAKERRLKRQGWLKQNSFHICITTYRLVIQDSKVFKRKKWKYLILDEAHLIKNWKSQRWQTLLNFNSKRRILLTGTPLQNDLMELWSLMHFLMPHIFQSHQEFKDWFSNPISGMIEGQERVNKEVIDRLHNVLRPFILRRLKRDVEKQLPLKYEHVINCRLSRRQRNLYEDFIASSETQATLASANFFGMIGVIMQLRKVCNHPDLFEGRPIVSSFDMSGIDMRLSSSICLMLSPDPFSSANLRDLGFIFTNLDFSMTSWESDETKALAVPENLITDQPCRASFDKMESLHGNQAVLQGTNIFEEIRKAVLEERLKEVRERAASIAWWNSLRCQKQPLYSTTLRETLTVKHPVFDIHQDKGDLQSYLYSSVLAEIVLSPVERFDRMIDLVESFMFAIPAARGPSPVCWCSKSGSSVFLHPTYSQQCAETLFPLLTPIRPAIVRRQVYFPDRRLIQFDCGKLQELAVLLRRLKSEGHRALIFTQMTKMLDILEAFINLYGYTYMRLDGSTQPEERQTLMQRFNTNPKIFLFILSTRSGGVGINLVGADTVIFYDSDWNPAMDQQAQDRCHRIGQTREVHIYRLISESTIEENILKKANQKRALDNLVIQSGGYNTEFFKKLDPMELFSGHRTLPAKNVQTEKKQNGGNDLLVSNAEVEAALKYAEDEADYMALKKVEQEEEVDNQEFTEEALGKLDEEEPINEDDAKTDEPADHGGLLTKKDNGLVLGGVDIIDKKTLALAGKEDETDMLDDVRQMAAAAAAAGQAISSFENQLRPIDRYAIRFLEIWDPIIEKSATDSEVRFDEDEWELDRIEKYKEEMEAEIDDNEEPMVYESWDADFATEVYRQQVEALAQHQLMEELEIEANEKDLDDGDYDSTRDEISSQVKPKAKKKKAKKSKFKSLKKGSLSSVLKPVKEEPIDEEDFSPEIYDLEEFSPVSRIQRKRKAESAVDAEEMKSSKRKPSKKLKKTPIGPGSVDFDPYNKLNGDSTEVKASNDATTELEQKSLSRSKAGGKISITTMPVKRVLMIKPEKLKKGNIWSKDCVPLPDSWLSQEDAILCAVVHEYGPHWSLVSETLYGMAAGGFYRGRYRHPVHCCERYRELIQRHILSAPENSANEKNNNMTPGKALIKVTEENVRTLLNFAAERHDQELLLQKHFTALLSSVWRTRVQSDRCQNLTSSCNGFPSGGGFLSSFISHSSRIAVEAPTTRLKFTCSGQSSKVVAAALVDASNREQDNLVSPVAGLEDAPVKENLDITLEFERESSDPMSNLPTVISLSISDPDPHSTILACGNDDHLRSSNALLEDRLREAVRCCVDDGPAWAASAFPTTDFKSRSALRLPSLGKHKLTSSDSSMKPAKSKSKRTLVEHDEAQRLFGEPVISAAIVAPNDPSLRFELPPTLDWDGWAGDTCDHWASFVNEGSTQESEVSDVVPHDYTPGLISALDDYSTLPDYTDIG